MRFALKRLTRSDLTFWEYQYRRQDAGNQKSVNLNANVFIDVIFPQARTAAGGHARQFPVPLTLYGPGLRPEPLRVTRKIIAAGDRQKNWRLNGEFIRDPDFDPTRYHGLSAGDIALFGFEGMSVPTAVALVLLAADEPSDVSLLETLNSFLGNRSMAEIDAEALGEAVDHAPLDHPIRELLDQELDEALEEAALGSAEGIRRLRQRRSTRRMSPEALALARSRVESIGRDGEIIVDAWLQKQVSEGRLKSATWVAELNAISPWDFEIIENSGEKVRVEVKSTPGPFERPFHISQSEIEAAAKPATRTDLYRVFSVSDNGARLRIASDIAPVAKDVLAKISALGVGFVPDGYSVDPLHFANWSDALELPNKIHEQE
jgi:hypothetical protein